MRKIKEITRDENIILLAIFLLSLTLRIFYFLVVYDNALVLEEFPYFSIGGNLAEGKGFGPEGIKFAPLYPLFLAPIYFLFGEFKAEIAIKAIQLILGTFSCILIFLAAKRIFNVKVGLISAFILALYDGMFFLNVYLLPENLVIPLGLLLLLALLRHQEKGKKIYHRDTENTEKIKKEGVSKFLFLRELRASVVHILDKSIINLVFSGILTGLLLLVDPKTFVLVGFLVGWVVLFSSRKIASLLLFFFFVGLTISPWMIRNYFVYDNPLLIDLNTKEIFFKYNYPYGASKLNEEKEPDLSKIRTFIKKDPRGYFNFFLKKLKFNLKNFLFSEKIWFEGAAEKPSIFIGKIKTPIPLISWKVLSLFGLLGIFLALKLWPKTSLLYFFSFAWLTSILVLLAGFPRFQLPLVPFLVIFASFGIYYIFTKPFKDVPK